MAKSEEMRKRDVDLEEFKSPKYKVIIHRSVYEYIKKLED